MCHRVWHTQPLTTTLLWASLWVSEPTLPTGPVRLAASAPTKQTGARPPPHQAHIPLGVELAVAGKDSGLLLPFRTHRNVEAERWEWLQRGLGSSPLGCLSFDLTHKESHVPLLNQEGWCGRPLGHGMGQQTPTWPDKQVCPGWPQPGSPSPVPTGRPGLAGISGIAGHQGGGQGLVPVTALSQRLRCQSTLQSQSKIT